MTVSAKEVAVVVLVGVALVLVVGNLIGQPVLIGFVETDSMSPALEAGDGFVPVPPLTGEPEPGDVVVYDAEVIQGGGLVTHRVVDERQGGYVTKGDSNPFTDQDGGEPLVAEDEVVAEALRVGGTVVSVPKLGEGIVLVRRGVAGLLGALGLSSALGTETTGVLLLVAGVFLLLLSFTGGRRYRDRSRSTSKRSPVSVPLVAGLMLLAVAVPANYAMVAPGQEHVIKPGAAVEDSDDITKGESEVTVHNEGLVTMAVALSPRTEAVSVTDGFVEVPPGEEKTVSAVPTRRSDRYVLGESRYFVVLPSTVLERLHSANPLLALAAVNLVISVGVVGLCLGALGGGRQRGRGGTSLATRLMRRLRNMV